MGMMLLEWEGAETLKLIPAHLYLGPFGTNAEGCTVANLLDP